MSAPACTSVSGLYLCPECILTRSQSERRTRRRIAPFMGPSGTHKDAPCPSTSVRGFLRRFFLCQVPYQYYYGVLGRWRERHYENHSSRSRRSLDRRILRGRRQRLSFGLPLGRTARDFYFDHLVLSSPENSH